MTTNEGHMMPFLILHDTQPILHIRTKTHSILMVRSFGKNILLSKIHSRPVHGVHGVNIGMETVIGNLLAMPPRLRVDIPLGKTTIALTQTTMVGRDGKM